MKKKNTDNLEVQEQIKLLSNVVEQTADNVMITDKEGIIEYVNPAFERTTGYKKEEVLGKMPSILKSGHHRKDYYQELWSTILSGKVFHAQTKNKDKKGKLFIADQTISPITSESGEVTHFVSVWKDVTERIEMQNKLQEAYSNLEFEKFQIEQILSFGENISLITKSNKLYDFITEKVCEILSSERCSLMLLDEKTRELGIKSAVGLSEKNFRVKTKVGEGIAGTVAKEAKPLLVKVIDTDERIRRGSRLSYKSKSFLSVPLMMEQKLIGVLNVTDKKSVKDNVYTELDLKIFLMIARHAAAAIENVQMYDQLTYLTITDSLTGLFNLRYFNHSLDHEIKRMNRVPRPLCLMMIDVDDLRSYNDAYGHVEGDVMLKAVGHVMKESCRDIDIICRYAGDEFMIILSETDIEEVKRIAGRILKGVEALKLKQKMTINIGIARCKPGMDRLDLISRVERALSEAKVKGKNQLFCMGE